MASKKPAPTRSAKAAAAKENGTPTVPKRIYAQASPHSQGGTSMFESQELITSSSAANFLSDPELVNRAALRLQDAGFEVLQISALTINIAGSPETYKKAFETTIVADERSVLKELGERSTATFLDSSDTGLSGLINTVGTRFEDVLEGVAIEEPRYFMAPSMFAPLKSYWHLRVPGDISLGCNADRAHRGGITGRGIKIAMVDSGHYSHPFFAGRGYRVSPVVLGPAAANPAKDESGHGTGESANIFAVAPDIQLMPVKINFVNSIGAFNAAVALAPDIITCSWGSSNQNGPLSAADQALAAAISVAVASGITVVFSAGNGHWGFPGQHPDVISAGGVFMNPDESLRASDYASGFMSNIYPGRRVPDLSGLVGMKPKAIYIMLPIESGDDIDVQLSGGTHPNGDETTNSDGWGAFSGTSAAAPQLAGAAALVKQAAHTSNPPKSATS
jgi:subtilisin family serine protease